MKKSNTLSKMKCRWRPGQKIEYFLPVGSAFLDVNAAIGSKVSLKFTGDIYCAECGEKTPKSYSQGYCFRHSQSLACNDMCQLKPETCHFHLGTCREPDWGDRNCMIPHLIYLANSSGLKVGITRKYQHVNRWVDQGAVSAIGICEVGSRIEAGLVETELKKMVSDKTNWRKMLKGEVEDLDLLAERERLERSIPVNISAVPASHEIFEAQYPVEKYPQKIVSLNFDKEPLLTGVLQGIKGQYLIFDCGVINIRKFTGYEVEYQGFAEVKSLPEDHIKCFTSKRMEGAVDDNLRTGPYGAW